MFKLGLVINPFAGVGGRVGLKGSDGEAIRQKALAMGAKQLATEKTRIALEALLPLRDSIEILTAAGEMGEVLSQQLGFKYQKISTPAIPSTADDTKVVISRLCELKVDLILFAGGDGTARDIFNVCAPEQMVLGVPAGVKIHSGVYAVSPQAAGQLVRQMVEGNILSLLSADVMDIDEQAFREGKVKAKKYGYLNVPGALEYVQAVKNGGKEVEALVLEDIAAEIIESMEDDCYYVIGSGTTCGAIMQQLGVKNTLLGSDIVFNEQLYKSDAIEQDFIELLEKGKKLKFIITVIGGQGHVLGRGNHQLSPQVIRLAGWNNFVIIATKTKLKELEGRPLLIDTGDSQLDSQLKGSKQVITGYRDFVIYPVGFEYQENIS